MTDRLPIYLLLAGCLIFGGVIVVDLEAATDDGVAVSASTAPTGAAVAVRRQPGTHVDELLATVLSRPLFSSTRRPPQSAASDGPSSADLGDTRLTGIITEPGRHLAIFAVNGAKPLRLTEGEAVSGWRIESITAREVSLSGPGGTKTLEPKVDPSLAQGSAPPPPVNPAARPPVPLPAGAAATPRPGGPPTLPNPPLPRPARASNRP
jgi:hypothetical protein